MTLFYAHEPHVDGSTTYSVGDKREADPNDVQHLVEFGVLSEKPPKASKSEKGELDYEADKLGEKPLDKANKNELLVIAAYEKADAPKGDEHTVAELRAAIEAKRKA